MMDLEKIYLEYQRKVHGYLVNRVHNNTIAEDLCSEVFLKIVHSASRFDESKASVSTWIYTITRNTLYDYYRTNHINEELDEAIDDGEAFLEKICTDAMLEQLADALEKLSKRERTIIIERFYDGKTLKEIAKKMNMSTSYVHVLQNSALKKLEKHLKN